MIHHKLSDEALRDFFAGLAMQGLIAHPLGGHSEGRPLARWAYEIADAMLEAKGTKYAGQD